MLKTDSGLWIIQEQTVEDPVTGLTFQFETLPGSDAPFRLRVFGKTLPHGNREILFDKDGVEAGGGVCVSGLCRPAWLQQTE